MATRKRIVHVDPRARTAVEAELADSLEPASPLEVTVEAVDSIAACVERLSEADAIVCEASVPDGTCVDLCRRVRNRRPSIPIVVFTDEGSEALAGEVVAAGADGYVPKSLGVETLRRRLAEILEGDRSTTTEHTPSALESVRDRSPFAIIEWNLELEVADWNPAATELFGYTAEAARGRCALELLVPDEVRDDVRVHWQSLLSANAIDDVHRVVNRNVREDGTTITCEWFNTPLYDDDELVGVLSFARDVSGDVKRATALEALQETTRELIRADSTAEVAEIVIEATETVVDGPFAAVRFYDPDADVLDVVETSAALEATGFTPPAVEPNASVLWDVYADELATVIDEGTSLDAPEFGLDLEYLLAHPLGDHGLLTVASSDGEIERVDRNLVHVLATAAEAALDRIASEEHLKRERDRFVALFENVPDAVVNTRQRDGVPIVEDVNPAFERLFGYEAEEIVGEPLDRFLVPAGRESEARTVNRRGNRGEIVEAEVKRRTADGLRDFRMRVVPIDVCGQTAERVFGLYTDVTEQKQRQKRVEVLNRVLRHDLRNGMNIIDGSAEMLADAVNGEHRTYARAIQERADELVGLAEKTRAVERTLERDGTGPVDVVAAIDRTVDRVDCEAGDADVTVTIDDSVPDPPLARADELLAQAIRQVVENAVEHADRDVPSVDVDLEYRSNDDVLVLTVADDGPGIPVEERELLGEEREITQLRHASGLGLWLVNWVVTQSGGQLRFESNEPRGTVVVLEIPRADPDSSRLADGETTDSE
ncbi:PAS domain S-box protein [Natrialbaceae archaeon GCM10025810]|uniref:hybrid sensor histidine kinase/response regulator n=1 Tax=Halovalidus salilacus TaxID=3075124 RepID=UPI00360DC625